MQEKDIKRLVKKQLKKKFPDWKKLTRNEKKCLVKQTLDSVLTNYDFNANINVPMNELLGTQTISDGIIPLSEMKDFIDGINICLFNLSRINSRKSIKDTELKSINALLDDRVINSLLSNESYTPSMRTLFPSHFLRAELLKSLKYPEISYRKFCKEIINNLEKKTERAFIGLPLHKGAKIDHTQMSQFRSSLNFTQLVNLNVYVIYLLINNSAIKNQFSICGVDSTELPAICNSAPLATIKVNGKKVRIYADLDADCGTRRNKRDKSKYFVGYRLHSLVALDPQSGRHYTLFSLIAPGNHHDKWFLPHLLSFSKAMGLNINLITADEAYANTEQNETIQKEFESTVITPPNKKVVLPINVDSDNNFVYLDDRCETPMDYVGRTESGHEFKCGDSANNCFYSSNCSKCREIPFDAGYFGQIPDVVAGVEDVRDLRKNMERAYNLFKHQVGLEPLRVRSQNGVEAVAVFSQMSMLLLEIIGTRRTKKKEKDNQLKFEFAA